MGIRSKKLKIFYLAEKTFKEIKISSNVEVTVSQYR